MPRRNQVNGGRAKVSRQATLKTIIELSQEDSPTPSI